MPRLLEPPVSPSRQRAWSPLAVSAGVHLVLLAVAAALTRPAPVPESSDRSDRPAEPARRVEMIYVPPPEPTRPPPPARPAPPPRPPAVRQTLPEPEPNAPPEATRTTGTESPDETQPGPGEPKADAASPALRSGPGAGRLPSNPRPSAFSAGPG